MTVDEIISKVDALEPNQYGREQKISWLSDLDELIFRDIYKTHAMPEEYPTEFNRYSTGSEDVLVSGAYGNEMYLPYLMSKIAKENYEIDKYNVEAVLYNNAFTEYANYINRNYMPNNKGRFNV